MKKVGLLLAITISIIFYQRQKPIRIADFQSDTKSVEIKGEVIHPGIYDIDNQATLDEIIELAGGLTELADSSSLNLTRDVVNHEVIVVAKLQEEEKISINTASLEKLDELPGIGPSIAQRIIDYRVTKPFITIEDLKEVKGIGDRLFEKLQDRICL